MAGEKGKSFFDEAKWGHSRVEAERTLPVSAMLTRSQSRRALHSSRDAHFTAKQRASAAKSPELPTDTLQIVFETLALDEYNAFRLVCKTWRIVLIDRTWYRIIRRNTLLPITPEGQSRAMCKNGFAGIRWTRNHISWSYEDNPWGYPSLHREYYLMCWHVDVLRAINEYIIEGGDNNVFCFNSTNVGWGRTEFTKFLGRMGAASDGYTCHCFDRSLGNAYKQARSIKSQILDTIRRGLFPIVAVDIQSGNVADKDHMQHIANILRQLRRFRIFGIYVPVVVFAKRYGPDYNIFPTTAADWLSNVKQEKDMWYDTGLCTNCASMFHLTVDGAQHRVGHA